MTSAARLYSGFSNSSNDGMYPNLPVEIRMNIVTIAKKGSAIIMQVVIIVT